MPESLTHPPGPGRARPLAAHRRASSVLGIAAAALLAAGAAGCSGKSAAGSSGGSAGAATGGSSQSASSSGAMNTPSTIASLQKAKNQSVAKSLLKQVRSSAGGAKLTAVSYQDGSDKSRTVLIYGGVGIPVPSGSPAAQLKSMLKSGTRTGVKIGQATTVDAGAAGGTAKCAPIPGSGITFVNCGWINGKSALVMSFNGFDQSSAKALVPQILAAMVKA